MEARKISRGDVDLAVDALAMKDGSWRGVVTVTRHLGMGVDDRKVELPEVDKSREAAMRRGIEWADKTYPPGGEPRPFD